MPSERDNFEKIHSIVEHWEGGYVDHPEDPGGPTNMGITLKTLERWRKRSVSREEVKALGRSEAREIFKAFYWTPLRCSEMPPPAATMVYNTGVLSGPLRAVVTMQEALNAQGAGLRTDGVIGPQTLAACVQASQARLVDDFAAAYERYLRSLPTFRTFGKGWLNRQADVRRAAIALIGGATLMADEVTRSGGAAGSSIAAIPAGEQQETILGLKSQGERVRALQLALERLNYPVGLIDGVFGTLTQGAVAAFQVANGLPGTGQVDLQTWAKIETAAPRSLPRTRTEATDQTLRPGSQIVRNADRTWWAGLASTILGALGLTNSAAVTVANAVRPSAAATPAAGAAPAAGAPAVSTAPPAATGPVDTVFDLLQNLGGMDAFGNAIGAVARTLLPGAGGSIAALAIGLAATAFSRRIIDRRVQDHREGHNLAPLRIR